MVQGGYKSTGQRAEQTQAWRKSVSSACVLPTPLVRQVQACSTEVQCRGLERWNHGRLERSPSRCGRRYSQSSRPRQNIKPSRSRCKVAAAPHAIGLVAGHGWGGEHEVLCRRTGTAPGGRWMVLPVPSAVAAAAAGAVGPSSRVMVAGDEMPLAGRSLLAAALCNLPSGSPRLPEPCVRMSRTLPPRGAVCSARRASVCYSVREHVHR
jgi:hypothetical protein